MTPRRRPHSKSASRHTQGGDGTFHDEHGMDRTQTSERENPAYSRGPSFNQERIGDILRNARELRGENLYAISEFLRIRPNFLAALENSQYENLPADAYVIGFLRSYAVYLGLDGKAAIDQYRLEMAGHRNKPQLNMPQPISEGRAPTFAILVSVTLAGLLLYALWYGLSSSSRTNIEPPTATISTPATPTTENPSSPAPAVVSENPPPATPATTPETQNVPAGSSENLAVTKAPADLAKTTETSNSSLPAQKESGEAAKSEGAAKEAPAPSTKTDDNKAQVSGSTSSSRLVIRAQTESWVLIADKKGNTVFDKILKPGETYSVPDTKGLRLTTGNGGGIVLSLDGADLPPLGAESRIVRNISLDPEKLKNPKSSAE